MMTRSTWIPLIAFFAISLSSLISYSQTNAGTTLPNGSQSNSQIFGAAFLLITPDARAGAMGNVGVATPGDANSSSINPAKLAYVSDRSSIGLSYSPWLKNLIPDVAIAYLGGYQKLDERNTLGASIRYFSLGEVQLFDINQQPLGISNPSELAVDISYARSFGENFSLGTSLRYISSNLSTGSYGTGQSPNSGTAWSMDIGGLFKKPTILFNTEAVLSAGFNISNIGTMINYRATSNKDYLPANLKIGGAAEIEIDEDNQFIFGLDLNKLLVSTQPIRDINGNIIKGSDPDKSVASSILASFSDAPGGFSEELKEISMSTGAEYWYAQKFAFRFGYNYENPNKGNNSYLTLGLGLKYNLFNLDFSYLLADANRNPLANTLRFSLMFNLSRKK